MTPGSFAGRTVAVTGGAGFIGQRLVRRLVEHDAARVVVLDRNAGRPASANSAVEYHAATLGAAPTPRLRELLDGVEIVFHLAAEKHSEARARPRDILEANVLGTHAVLDAATDAGVSRVVFASSLYAYGPGRGNAFAESDTPLPDTVYGISKLAGEHLGARMARRGGPGFVALRYFFAYGPEQTPLHGRPSLIVRTFERLARGLPPIIRGDGSQGLDYVYVDDIVEATIRAVTLASVPDVVNVGSGRAPSVRELVAHMQQIAGTRLRPIVEDADNTEGTRRVASTEKMERLLGLPTVTLDEGLERTWNWVRAVAEEP